MDWWIAKAKCIYVTCPSLSNTFLETAPNFVTYFENLLVQRVWEYVFNPNIPTRWIPLNWTNNNCESLNNILKLSTNWKILKLPDLIEKMYLIVKVQYADMRRALHGHRNYKLVPKLKHLVLPHGSVDHKDWGREENTFSKVFLHDRWSKENNRCFNWLWTTNSGIEFLL